MFPLHLLDIQSRIHPASLHFASFLSSNFRISFTTAQFRSCIENGRSFTVNRFPMRTAEAGSPVTHITNSFLLHCNIAGRWQTAEGLSPRCPPLSADRPRQTSENECSPGGIPDGAAEPLQEGSEAGPWRYRERSAAGEAWRIGIHG